MMDVWDVCLCGRGIIQPAPGLEDVLWCSDCGREYEYDA